MDTLDVLIRTVSVGHPITNHLCMNYSDFHKNRVRYNINTTNKAKSKFLLFRYLNCIIN